MGRWARLGSRFDLEGCVHLVLLVPLTYGLGGLHALRLETVNKGDLWTSESLVDCAELYSSLALFAFHHLLSAYDADADELEVLPCAGEAALDSC